MRGVLLGQNAVSLFLMVVRDMELKLFAQLWWSAGTVEFLFLTMTSYSALTQVVCSNTQYLHIYLRHGYRYSRGCNVGPSSKSGLGGIFAFQEQTAAAEDLQILLDANKIIWIPPRRLSHGSSSRLFAITLKSTAVGSIGLMWHESSSRLFAITLKSTAKGSIGLMWHVLCSWLSPSIWHFSLERNLPSKTFTVHAL